MRFHWFTHFFVGASVAFAVGAVYAWRTQRPVRLPLLWVLAAHAFAMFPDFLFQAGVAHHRWMDLFLGHISTHFVPGRNLTWFVVAAIAFGAYLISLDRIPDQDRPPALTPTSPAKALQSCWAMGSAHPPATGQR